MIESLKERLGGAVDNADTVLAATVQALSETAWRETEDLRSQLPGELAKVGPAGVNQQRTLDEFIARIGELSGTADMAQAREYAQAGFGVLSDAVSAGQLRQLMQDLPEEYGSLAPALSGMAGNEQTLLAEVRRQADLDDVDQARELTQAVFAVLGEATSGGQAARLATAVPQDLAAWLQAPEQAEHTDSDRFLNEVARRSSVTTSETVRAHVSAVFTSLRQWAPDELADTLGQLPYPLAQLSVRP